MYFNQQRVLKAASALVFQLLLWQYLNIQGTVRVLQAVNGTSRIIQCRNTDFNSNFKKIVNVEATWNKTPHNRQDNKQQKQEVPFLFVVTCKTALIAMQESKRGKKRDIFQIQKVWNMAADVYKKNTETFFFFLFQLLLLPLGYRKALVINKCATESRIFQTQELITPSKTLRPKCTPKVDSSISQRGSCAPNEAHTLSPLHLETETVGRRRFHSYIVQGALFLLESSLSFALLWFFLSTELFQSPHLLFEVLMLIPKRGRKEKVCSISWNIQMEKLL